MSLSYGTKANRYKKNNIVKAAEYKKRSDICLKKEMSYYLKVIQAGDRYNHRDFELEE